jgi:uncharacterized repeat protein (TIGR03806 family)
MNLYRWAGLLFLPVLLAGLAPERPELPRMKLSEYGFFSGNLVDLKPASNVFPYEVNAPLFSDYAEKARFVFLPENTKLRYDADAEFSLPVGAVIIKVFYYHNDASKPENGRKIQETRLLIKEEHAWKALTYIWNAEQTDAELEVAGASFPVQWVNSEGKKKQVDYVVPNVNQCKGCHSFDGNFTPIGLTARQLNLDIRSETGMENQLALWQKQGRLELPEGFDPAQAPRLSDYRKTDASMDARARGYLDANCAHCHNPHGPASTSGLFLESTQTNPERLGVGKPPVAAGRGSGKRQYGIVPGKPNESILLFRMESSDPGIRMPELGRQLEHREGVELIRNWIKEMK